MSQKNQSFSQGFSMVFPWFSLQNPMGSHGQSPVKRRRSSARSWPAQRTQPFGARRSATRRRTRRSIPGDIGSCEDTWRCLGRGAWEIGRFGGISWHFILSKLGISSTFHPHFIHKCDCFCFFWKNMECSSRNPWVKCSRKNQETWNIKMDHIGGLF